MKKITTALNLIGIKGNINYSKETIKQFREYLKDGVDCQEVINIHQKELLKWQNVLNKYRQDVTFLKVNKIIKYSK